MNQIFVNCPEGIISEIQDFGVHIGNCESFEPCEGVKSNLQP